MPALSSAASGFGAIPRTLYGKTIKLLVALTRYDAKGRVAFVPVTKYVRIDWKTRELRVSMTPEKVASFSPAKLVM